MTPPHSPRAAFTMRSLGAFLCIIAITLPLLVFAEDLPWWALDPAQSLLPAAGLTPWMTLALVALACIGSLLVHLAPPRVTTRADLVAHALALISLLAVLAHTLSLRSDAIDTLALGGVWSSSILAALAIHRAARDDARLRASLVAIVLAALMPLVCKSAAQVLIEHPITLARFRADPASVLAAQGIEIGSDAARLFERRLSQPDPTGWLALSNVLASLMGAGALALGAFSLLARGNAGEKGAPRATRLPRIACALAAIACLAILIATRSKGALGATLIGALSLAIALTMPRVLRSVSAARLASRAIALLPLAATLVVLALVALRGIVAERINELSLLFRWFYAVASVRIFAAHPLLGVGPTGYKDAYLLNKVFRSPEEVTSPHSVMFDWLATLGLPALAWIVLLTLAALAIGRTLAIRARPGEPATLESDPLPAHAARPSAGSPLRRAAIIMPLVLTILAAFIERPAMTPDGAIVRLAGLGLWIALALAIERVALARPLAAALALASASVMLLAHAQIELVATLPASCGVFFVLLALAASFAPLKSAPHEAPRRVPVSRPAPALFACIPALVLCVASVSYIPRAWRWEGSLADAALPFTEIDAARAELELAGWTMSPDQTAPAPGADPLALTSAAAILSNLTGRPVAASPNETRSALARASAAAIIAAIEPLTHAHTLRASDFPTLRVLVSAQLRVAASARTPADARARFEALGASLEREREDHPSAAVHGLAALAYASRAAFERAAGDPASALAADLSAIDALRAARRLDPYSLALALRELDTQLRVIEADPDHATRAEIAALASDVLRLNDGLYLDPLRQLSGSERARIETLASPDPAPDPS
ncbi:MAG: O-antigen ligase family protein [Phycisphaerales bacterium]|jgi:hypothetical protein|nr:O-antigen ligase family protein [Phycisphaerales bacterium]